MKRILTITTATLALGALAACGNDAETTAYDDNAAEETLAQTDDATLGGQEGMDQEEMSGTQGYGTAGNQQPTTAADRAGDPSMTGQQRAELETRLADATSPTVDYNGQTYLSDSALNARDLTGAAVIGADGERVASVDDVIIDAGGNARSLVLSSGGFLGIGDKQITVDFDQVDVAFDSDNEARITTSLSEEAVDSAAEFDEDSVSGEMWLAGDLLGQEVELGTQKDTAAIYDLIMDESGAVDHVVLSTGLGSERYLVTFASLQPGSQEDSWMISMTPERLENETRIVYF